MKHSPYSGSRFIRSPEIYLASNFDHGSRGLVRRFSIAIFLSLCLYPVWNIGKTVAQPSSYVGAMRWYEREALKGSANAQYLLGMLYAEGGGSRKKDPSAALGWFAKAARQGHAAAQFRVGAAYQFGRTVIPDIAQAFIWYQRAARQGIVEAQHNLAHMLENGPVTDQNVGKAVRWYAKAARRGFGPSQLALGNLYLRGNGLKKNFVEAWAWFRAAEFRGINGASEAMEFTAKNMKPDQLRRAKTLSLSRIQNMSSPAR